MAPYHRHARFDRRHFLKRSAAAAGWFGLAAAAGHIEISRAAASSNPFAYDVSRLTKVDPKLVHYEEVGRFRSPHQDARRLAIGPQDSLYVAAGNYVTALDGEGLTISDVALPGPARCLALTPEGDLYVGLRDHVEVFDRKGRRRAAWQTPGPRTWLTGLSVSGKDVYLADAGNRVVLRCDLSGRVLARIGEKNKQRNVPGFIVPSPFFDLRMHSDGLLRVTNPGRHRVETYTPEGDLELTWGKASNGIDGFCGCCNPIHIALLGDGRVVTCEKGLPRVKVYSLDGALESVVAGPESFPENLKGSSGESFSDGTHGGLDAAVSAKGRIYILDQVKGDIRAMARRADSPRSGKPHGQT